MLNLHTLPFYKHNDYVYNVSLILLHLYKFEIQPSLFFYLLISYPSFYKFHKYNDLFYNVYTESHYHKNDCNYNVHMKDDSLTYVYKSNFLWKDFIQKLKLVYALSIVHKNIDDVNFQYGILKLKDFEIWKFDNSFLNKLSKKNQFISAHKF